MDKYEELYNLSKYLLGEQLARPKRLDERASSYFSVLTVAVPLYGLFANWFLGEIVPLKSWGRFDWILVVTIGITLLVLCLTWLVLYRSLEAVMVRQIPMNDEMIQFFEQHRPIDIWYTLAKGNKDAMDANWPGVKHKAQMVSTGYKLVGLSAVLIIVVTALCFCYRVTGYGKSPGPQLMPQPPQKVELLYHQHSIAKSSHKGVS